MKRLSLLLPLLTLAGCAATPLHKAAVIGQPVAVLEARLGTPYRSHAYPSGNTANQFVKVVGGHTGYSTTTGYVGDQYVSLSTPTDYTPNVCKVYAETDADNRIVRVDVQSSGCADVVL